MEYTFCFSQSSGREEFLGIGKIRQGKVLGSVAKYLPLDTEPTPAQQPYFRTSESCPMQHDQRHLGRIFTMTQESLDVHGVGNKDRYPNWMLRTELVEHQQCLNEHAFLLRHVLFSALCPAQI